MAQPGLLLDHDSSTATATITINHPAKRNAMTVPMWRALPPLLDDLAADPSVRVVVLTGAGDTFCAGADIAGLRAAEPERGAQGAAVAAEEALAAFPKPTVAAIRGFCVGGGCQLVVACDLRFAAHGGCFGVTPARLGIVYAASSTRRLAALVGPSMAKYLLFSAELIDGERALRSGLVDELVAPEALAARVAEFAAVLAGRSRLTQTAAKEFTAMAVQGDEPDPGRLAYWARQARESPDLAEGVAAFLERRTPHFTWDPASAARR